MGAFHKVFDALGEPLSIDLPIARRGEPVAVGFRIPGRVEDEQFNAHLGGHLHFVHHGLFRDLHFGTDAAGDQTAPAGHQGPEHTAAGVVVQGVDAVVEIPNHQAKVQRRRCHRFPGIQHPQGGGSGGSRLERQPGRAAGGSVVQIKFEAVAPRKGQGANQVLSGLPVVQDEQGMAVTVPAKVSVNPVACVRHILPMEVAAVAPMRILEVAKPIGGGLAEGPFREGLEHARPGTGGRQWHGRFRMVGDLQPPLHEAGSVQLRVHLDRNGTVGVHQRHDELDPGFDGDNLFGHQGPVGTQGLSADLQRESLGFGMLTRVDALAFRRHETGAVPASADQLAANQRFLIGHQARAEGPGRVRIILSVHVGEHG